MKGIKVAAGDSNVCIGPSSKTVVIVDGHDYELVKRYSWVVNAPGYLVASVDDRVVYLSHFLLDVPDGMVIVHLNGDRFVFRRVNLRIITRSEAMQRQKKRAGTSSQYKGVQRHKKSGRWRALLWRGELRRFQHLGYFELETEAARQVYGEDAWVNFE